MTLWLVIFCGGLLTFLTRFSFIGLLGGRQIPTWAADALRLVPIAALSAIVAAELAAPQPTPALAWIRWASAAVALVIAWLTKGVGWAVLGGMTVFLLLRLW